MQGILKIIREKCLTETNNIYFTKLKLFLSSYLLTDAANKRKSPPNDQEMTTNEIQNKKASPPSQLSPKHGLKNDPIPSPAA